jgi:hemerythrin-like domain-containing protein
MSPETATARLREEHQLILQVVGVLERMVAAADSSGEVDFVTFDRLISFLRLYVDLFHHGQEEGLLFPELGNQGLPQDGGPVAVMLYEHGQGRALIRAMVDSFDDARRGDPAAQAGLLGAARGYVELLRSHIGKEDQILFGMADQLITGTDLTHLCGAYDTVADGVFEGSTRRDLLLIAGRLLEQYPPSPPGFRGEYPKGEGGS